jgi:hypothetical protein
MKPESSHALLDTLEADVERQLQQVIASFQNLSEKKLTQPRADGGWSIAQCFAHLNSYCDYYLPKIEKGLSVNHPTNDTFKSTWLGRYFTNIMKPQANMNKFKAIKAHEPAFTVVGHQEVAVFIEHQEMLLTYLQQARNSDLNKIKIPISILPWIKLRLGNIFQFLIAHQERHLQQAKRLT